jgi:hypothetical protein
MIDYKNLLFDASKKGERGFVLKINDLSAPRAVNLDVRAYTVELISGSLRGYLR